MVGRTIELQPDAAELGEDAHRERPDIARHRADRERKRRKRRRQNGCDVDLLRPGKLAALHRIGNPLARRLLGFLVVVVVGHA
jgi:hypothetical protein